MSDPKNPEADLDQLSKGLQDPWESFIDEVEPLRPDLFRFCQRLCGNAFDAEDLVHEGLLRAFGRLAVERPRIRNVRAFLLRVFTNLWIDEQRRLAPELREAAGSEADPNAADPGQGAELREAAETLFGTLAPRERVAVVLKEAFDLSHAQVAEVLSSTEGAVRVALHRGRAHLADQRSSSRRPARVSRALVERFVEAFRSHDLERVKALLLEDVEAEVFPSGSIVGRDVNAEEGWLRGCFFHHIPAREAEQRPYPLGLRVDEVEGEPVVLVFRDYGDAAGPALEEVWRFEEDSEGIARVRDYGFSPDLVGFVAECLGLPFRKVGYRLRPGVFLDTDVEDFIP